MLPLLFLLLVSPIIGSPASPEEEEDYDFEEVVGLSLNDSVLVFSDEADEESPFQEAAVTIMLTEIEQLRSSIVKKEEEVELLETKMKNAEEKSNSEKAKYEKLLSNKNVLTRFLSFGLRNNEKKARISRDLIEAQNEML